MFSAFSRPAFRCAHRFLWRAELALALVASTLVSGSVASAAQGPTLQIDGPRRVDVGEESRLLAEPVLYSWFPVSAGT